MDLEFHYHVTYLIALGGGFNKEDAQKIAYSSQYVDDNCMNFSIKDTGGNTYKNIATQNYVPSNLNKVSKEIYIPFHFVPKCTLSKSKRKDGLSNIMEVESNSKIALVALKNALISKNAHWIGIAAHAFMDGWAHQNFTGYAEVYNNINHCYIAKNIGHSDALAYPDAISLIWKDARLKSEIIDNNKRFLEASKELLRIFSEFNNVKINNKLI